jgi:predicted aldo/keto reductase-like oxidoreductase
MEKNSLNRRNFLRIGAVATAGIATGACKTTKTTSSKSKGNEIITRTLGKTGIEVPIVSMGVMRADNPNILKAALDLGVKHFDTAHSYQDGRNEEMVGEFFKDKDRKSVIISTKVHPPKEGMSTDEFLEKFEISLKRLQMDYVDILYLHVANNREYTLDERYLKALKIAKESGKTRFVGVSTHRNMAEVLNAAVDSNFYDIVLTTYNFKYDGDEEMQKALQRANDAGLGIVGMKNMAGKFLDRKKTKPVDCKAALKWASKNPLIHTNIPGITTYEMLMENWSVMKDLTLSEQEKQGLELAMAEPGMFCKGCETCMGQCPKDLPIPDLMRSYMYNYGYSYPAKAFKTVASLNISANPCDGCVECSVNCPNGFKIREKVTDIARIQVVPKEFLV